MKLADLESLVLPRTDVFISYKVGESSQAYGDGLANALKEAGVTYFFDVHGIATGDELQVCLEAAEKSLIFVLLGSAESLKSDWVKQELEAYAMGRRRFPQMLFQRYLVINVDGAIDLAQPLFQEMPWSLLKDRRFEAETLEAFETGQPTPAVVNRIVNSCIGVKAKTVSRTVLGAILASILVLSGVLAGASHQLGVQRGRLASVGDDLTKGTDALTKAEKDVEAKQSENETLTKSNGELTQEKSALGAQIKSAEQKLKSAGAKADKEAARANKNMQLADASSKRAEGLRLENLQEQGRGWMLRNDWRKALPLLSSVYASSRRDPALTYLVGSALTTPRAVVASLPAPIEVRAAAYSGDGKVLAVLDRKVRCYDTKTWRSLGEFGCEPGTGEEERRTTDFFLNEDGSRAVTLEDYTALTDPEVGTKQTYQTLVLWDVRSGKEIATMEDDEGVTFGGFHESPFVLCSATTLNPQTRFIDSRSGKVVWETGEDVGLATYGNGMLAIPKEGKLAFLSMPKGKSLGSVAVGDVTDIEWNEKLKAFVMIMSEKAADGTSEPAAVYTISGPGSRPKKIFEASVSADGSPDALEEIVGNGNYVQYRATGDMDLGAGLEPLVPSLSGCTFGYPGSLVRIAGTDSALLSEGGPDNWETVDMRGGRCYIPEPGVQVQGKLLAASPDGKRIVTQDNFDRLLVWRLGPQGSFVAPPIRTTKESAGFRVRTKLGVKALSTTTWDRQFSPLFDMRFSDKRAEIGVGGKMICSVETVDKKAPLIAISPSGRFCAFGTAQGVTVFDGKARRAKEVKHNWEHLRIVGWTPDENLIVEGSRQADDITPVGMKTEGYELANPWMTDHRGVSYVAEGTHGASTIPTIENAGWTTTWIQSGRNLWILDDRTKTLAGTYDIAPSVSAILCLSSTKSIAVCAAPGNSAVVRDTRKGLVLTELRSSGGLIQRAKFICDDTLILTEREDGVAEIWDAASGSLLESHPHFWHVVVGPKDGWISHSKADGASEPPLKYSIKRALPSSEELTSAIRRLNLGKDR